MKYDKNGNREWKVYGHTNSSYFKIVLDDCGNVYAAENGSAINLYKYNKDGNEIWHTTFNPFHHDPYRGFLEVDNQGQFYMGLSRS